MTDISVLMARGAFGSLAAGLLLLAGGGWCAIRARSARWWVRPRWEMASDGLLLAGGAAMLACWVLLGVSVLWWHA